MPKRSKNIVKLPKSLTITRGAEIQLEKLAENHMHYTRDIKQLDWLINYPYIEISEEDKIALMNARVSAEFKLSITNEQIGSMRPCLRIGTATRRAPSPELGVDKLYDMYYMQYVVHQQDQLKTWLAQYKRAKTNYLFLEFAKKKAPRFVKRHDEQKQQADSLRNQIIDLARAGDNSYELILPRLQDAGRVAEVRAQRRERFANNRRLVYKNSAQIIALLKAIDVYFVAVECLGTAKQPLGMVEAFAKQMIQFQELTGYTLQEWYKRKLKVPERALKQR